MPDASQTDALFRLVEQLAQMMPKALTAEPPRQDAKSSHLSA